MWRDLSIPRLARRAGPYPRHFLRHLATRPYRVGLPARRGSARVRAAVYDAVMNLLLDGYADLAGHALRPETGRLVVRLNRLLAAFDDRFEHRRATGASLAFDDVLGDPPVPEHLAALADFLAGYPEGTAIRGYLTGRIADQYDGYVTLASAPDATVDLDRQLELARLDSAGFAQCFAQSVGLFHRETPDPPALDQFAGLGMVAKLADDILDFAEDHVAGAINLMRGILHRYLDEERRAVDRPAGERTGIAWWRAHCPRAFTDFTALVQQQRGRLSSARLRLASDLMLVPVRRGRTLLRSAPVGLRI